MDKSNELNGKKSEKNIAMNGCQTPEKKDKPQIQINDLTPIKESNKCESNIFKTPEKITQSSRDVVDKGARNGNKTPEKTCENLDLISESKTESESGKVTQNNKLISDADEKGVRNGNKTPEKTCENLDLTSESKTESESFMTNDGEEGLISTTEQARLLIAASKTPSKTPSKSAYKTPVKNGTPSGKRSLENSPYTPGKHKRADLITLSSPKMKRLKQM